ncbi:hypothetical protein N7466_009620 [Penicillium verhagenii]|uniref:uncharacterized protein n=1 Tax=Penicillium verhagenii TaxID=1562060 RepID=UPI0025456FFA|nr:uncharacterized protein N7466_009620 [Penicillium verhagenii]KAJ5921294.1 hypothetical protein N7466_009620 [Penicillium verhagenii]
MLTIAFFGPTGGCANACLAYTLLNGHKAIALARTPAKLTTQLLEQPGLTTAILNTQLRIIQGDATDMEAVMQTLLVSETPRSLKSAGGDSATSRPVLVDMIVSGIGGTGAVSITKASSCDKIKMRVPSLPYVDLANPQITEQFTVALLGALGRVAGRFSCFEEYAGVAPRLVIVSTTGIKAGSKDVPFWVRMMYDMLLAIPHEDKKRMEELLEEERGRENSLLVRGLIVVRPSLLEGDHKIVAPGVDDGYEKKLRVGTEKEPAVGYTVPRAWVGRWIFEEVLKTGGDEWVGEGAILTA